MTFGRRLRRSLARRFPKTRRAYNWTRAKTRSVIGRAWRGCRKIGTSAVWSWRLLAALRSTRAEPRLTVAVDVAAFWEPLTGIGWYLRRLLEHLATRADVQLLLFPPTIVHSPDLQPPAVDLPAGPALRRLRYEVPPEQVLFAGRVTRILRRLEPLLIAAHGADVLFAPNYFLPRRFSLARGALVATVHDLGFREVPWTLREETLQELGERFDRTLARADRLITVSGAVRRELIDHGYFGADRIHVVRHGPGQLASVPATEPTTEIPQRFALHVGTLEPRKNVATLLACWRLLRERLADAPVLLLCGRYGWKTEAIRRDIETGQSEGWLRHLGYVSDQELATLYHRAAVVVFPSLYEGFGLPAVEAQWAGAPLVCSDLPVLREVAGDAALFAPPDRPDLLAEAIERVLADPELRQGLIARGRERAQSLSWERAAEETLAVWRLAAVG